MRQGYARRKLTKFVANLFLVPALNVNLVCNLIIRALVEISGAAKEKLTEVVLRVTRAKLNVRTVKILREMEGI